MYLMTFVDGTEGKGKKEEKLVNHAALLLSRETELYFL